MIAYADIQDRIDGMRTDKLAREFQLAFQVSARRLAELTLGVQEIVTFTVPADTQKMLVYDPAETTDRVSLFVFKAERLNEDTGKWISLPNLNQRQEQETTLHPTPRSGDMFAFTTDQGLFVPYRPPVVDTQVRATVAYKPVGDFDEVAFGAGFEDALVEGALSHLYRLPGPERDLRAAADAESKFISEASGLRGIVLIGDMGYAKGSGKVKRHRFGFDHYEHLGR
jgi:hypothetical protein